MWYGDSRRGARQGAGPHSPVAIQAHLRQLSTFPTWKKKNPSAHELGTVRMIKFTGDWLGAGRIRLGPRKLPREGEGKTAQQVSAAEPDALSSILEPTWQREKSRV